jgi:hypothetical protein
VDVREKHQLDMAEQVARVRARARPWRSIIALVLAMISVAAWWWVTDSGSKLKITLAGHPAGRALSAGCAVAFCLFALAATVGLSGKAREVLEPRLGSAHAAVIRYAIVLAGGLTSLLITLELLKVQVGNLILGGAFTAVLIGIAAQQTLGNLFAGIVLLLARPFVVGDSVRMRAGALSGQIEGTVTDIGITYVRLDTDEGKLNVPNSQVLAAAVGPVRQSRAAAPDPASGSAASAPSGHSPEPAQAPERAQSPEPAQPPATGQSVASAQPPATGQSVASAQPPATGQSVASAHSATTSGATLDGGSGT